MPGFEMTLAVHTVSGPQTRRFSVGYPSAAAWSRAEILEHVRRTIIDLRSEHLCGGERRYELVDHFLGFDPSNTSVFVNGLPVPMTEVFDERLATECSRRVADAHRRMDLGWQREKDMRTDFQSIIGCLRHLGFQDGLHSADRRLPGWGEFDILISALGDGRATDTVAQFLVRCDGGSFEITEFDATSRRARIDAIHGVAAHGVTAQGVTDETLSDGTHIKKPVVYLGDDETIADAFKEWLNKVGIIPKRFKALRSEPRGEADQPDQESNTIKP